MFSNNNQSKGLFGGVFDNNNNNNNNNITSGTASNWGKTFISEFNSGSNSKKFKVANIVTVKPFSDA